MARINLGATCSATNRTNFHELGHVLGFHHEDQRSDRDNYITIDIGNVPGNARFAFDKYTFPAIAPYDGSIMHYGAGYLALDLSRPTIIPKPEFQSHTAQMGAQVISDNDHNHMALLYNSQMRESTIRTPIEATRTRFDRADMLLAMERLRGFYMSRMASIARRACRSAAAPTSSALHSGFSTSTCPPGLRVSAPPARSTLSWLPSRVPTNGDRRIRAEPR